MTKRERSSRPDHPSRERSPDAPLDRYLPDRGSLDRGSLDQGSLDQGARPDGDPARSQPVAQVLAALTSAPESSELTGEAQALAEFRAFAEFGAFAAARARGADLPSPAPRGDPGRMTWRPAGRLTVAAATGAVLMGGLLAVAYAGDLPVPAQRLAHDAIDAPAVGPDRDPAVSSQLTGSPNSAGRASHQATQAPVEPDRRVHSGSASGDPHRHGSSGSPSGSSAGRLRSGRLGLGRLGSGRQGQSGRPGRTAEPGPAQVPSPSASISPPASATPSPSADPSPSQSGPPYPQQSPSSPQSPPP